MGGTVSSSVVSGGCVSDGCVGIVSGGVVGAGFVSSDGVVVVVGISVACLDALVLSPEVGSVSALLPQLALWVWLVFLLPAGVIDFHRCYFQMGLAQWV